VIAGENQLVMLANSMKTVRTIYEYCGLQLCIAMGGAENEKAYVALVCILSGNLAIVSL
jgi:hypothetical protein